MGTLLHCIPWASSDFPLLHRGLCQAWLQQHRGYTKDTLPPASPSIPAQPAQQEANLGDTGIRLTYMVLTRTPQTPWRTESDTSLFMGKQ